MLLDPGTVIRAATGCDKGSIVMQSGKGIRTFLNQSEEGRGAVSLEG